MENNILGSEKIPKLFVKYSIPAIFAMLIVGTQSIVDGLFVGNYVGETAMASVNIAQPFTQTIVAASMIIVIGSLSFMGRSLGENNIEKTQNIYRTSLILLIIIASILTISGVFFSNEIALLLGATDILINDTSMYIKVISIFLIPMFLMYQFAFSNRLLERPDLYINGMILSLITNLILNIILVKYMNFGVMGTAIATGLAEPFALFFVIGPHLNKKNTINIFVGKFDKSTIFPVISNGASEGMTSIATALTAYVFNITLLRESGEIGVTAFTIISYITLFTTYIMFGISDGVSPIISYNYGAKNFKRVKEVMNFSYVASFLIGSIIFIFILIFKENIIGLFISDNEAIIKIATLGITIFAFSYLINGFNILTSAYFTSIGLAKESIIIALSRGAIFTLIGIKIFPKLFSVNGIWMSVPFAEVITILICYYLLRMKKE